MPEVPFQVFYGGMLKSRDKEPRQASRRLQGGQSQRWTPWGCAGGTKAPPAPKGPGVGSRGRKEGGGAPSETSAAHISTEKELQTSRVGRAGAPGTGAEAEPRMLQKAPAKLRGWEPAGRQDTRPRGGSKRLGGGGDSEKEREREQPHPTDLWALPHSSHGERMQCGATA